MIKLWLCSNEDYQEPPRKPGLLRKTTLYNLQSDFKSQYTAHLNKHRLNGTERSGVLHFPGKTANYLKKIKVPVDKHWRCKREAEYTWVKNPMTFWKKEIRVSEVTNFLKETWMSWVKKQFLSANEFTNFLTLGSVRTGVKSKLLEPGKQTRIPSPLYWWCIICFVL